MIGISIFGLPEISNWYAEEIYVYIMPLGYGLAHVGRVGSVFVTVSAVSYTHLTLPKNREV